MSQTNILGEIIRETSDFQIEWGKIVRPELRARYTGGFAEVFLGKIQASYIPANIKITPGVDGFVDVAVKVLNKGDQSIPFERITKRLLREVMAWRKLDHQNVVPLLGYSLDEDTWTAALICPWYEKGSLFAYLKSNQSANRKDLALGIALGMEHLHTRTPAIIHGDLKSDNILIDDDGNPRIGDFGLATMLEDGTTNLTTTASLHASYRWLAPEVACDGARTKASDVWAFGCTLIEVITGSRPFPQAPNSVGILKLLTTSNETLDPCDQLVIDREWKRIMKTCWVENPAKRLAMPELVREVRLLEETLGLARPQHASLVLASPSSSNTSRGTLSRIFGSFSLPRAAARSPQEVEALHALNLIANYVPLRGVVLPLSVPGEVHDAAINLELYLTSVGSPIGATLAKTVEKFLFSSLSGWLEIMVSAEKSSFIIPYMRRIHVWATSIKLRTPVIHLLADAPWLIPSHLEHLANRFHRAGHQTVAQSIRRSVDDVYLTDYAAQAQRLALHHVDAQGRIQCTRVCSTTDERKLEARGYVKRMLESRLSLARASFGVDVASVMALAEALRKKMEGADRYGEIVDIHHLLAEVCGMNSEEPNLISLSSLADSLHKLGVSWGRLGEHHHAFEALAEVVKLHRRLADQNPSRYIAKLATSLYDLGVSLSHVDKHGDAVDVTKEAVKLGRYLAAEDPTRYTSLLADSLDSLGVHLGNLNNPVRANIAAEEAQVLRQHSPKYRQPPPKYEQI